MISRWLFLEPGQLRRACPFFALYLVLFAALTLADGLSLSLLVTRVGAAALPRYQAVSAVGVMAVVAWYLRTASRRDDCWVFAVILGGAAVLFAAVWVALRLQFNAGHVLGGFFVARELAYAMVLLHFGAYLQGYFARAELNRVMPVIYAGGRLGGIAAGGCLQRLSATVAPAQMLAVLPAMLAVGVAGVWLIGRTMKTVDEPTDPSTAELAAVSRVTDEPSFLARLWHTPLLFWITLTTAALFFCRSGLSLQSGLCFQHHFADEAELARFLGRYSQYALALSLPIQLLVVGRLVERLGLHGTQMLYAVLVTAAALVTWGEMTLAGAIFARFVETELRFAVRNPLAQMTVNLFPRQVRTSARAWSLGMLIPITTLAASACFATLVRWESLALVSVLTLAAGIAYLVTSFGLGASIRQAIATGTTLPPVARQSRRGSSTPGPLQGCRQNFS